MVSQDKIEHSVDVVTEDFVQYRIRSGIVIRMDSGRKIEMQERMIELLAKALTPDPENQRRLIRVAEAEAMEILPCPVPDSYPVNGHTPQPEDL